MYLDIYAFFVFKPLFFASLSLHGLRIEYVCRQKAFVAIWKQEENANVSVSVYVKWYFQAGCRNRTKRHRNTPAVFSFKDYLLCSPRLCVLQEKPQKTHLRQENTAYPCKKYIRMRIHLKMSLLFCCGNVENSSKDAWEYICVSWPLNQCEQCTTTQHGKHMCTQRQRRIQ